MIYQTEAAARAKVDRLLALDVVKGGTTFDEIPPLVRPPVVESRPVGEWERLAVQQEEPTDEAVERISEWVTPEVDAF
jgi:hypothetical protein